MISSAPESTTWRAAGGRGEHLLLGAPRRRRIATEDDARATPRVAPLGKFGVVARSKSVPLTPPDWWRHGRTELGPTTCA